MMDQIEQDSYEQKDTPTCVDQTFAVELPAAREAVMDVQCLAPKT